MGVAVEQLALGPAQQALVGGHLQRVEVGHAGVQLLLLAVEECRQLSRDAPQLRPRSLPELRYQSLK